LNTTTPTKPSYQGLSIGHLYPTLKKHIVEMIEYADKFKRISISQVLVGMAWKSLRLRNIQEYQNG
jgi:hypothetical protein